MKIAIMSDLHGNLCATQKVCAEIKKNNTEAIILLGDVIDYGMHSNEVIELISSIGIPIICNIWGNHEDAIMNDKLERFSSDRGRACSLYTKSVLSEKSFRYISENMYNKGHHEFVIDEKKCLAIHGSLEDEYWKSISYTNNLEAYKEYDYVFSGHSHLPHVFETFFKVEDEVHRNKKKTVFINPGSVGQPRNLCNCAQYVVWNTETGAVSFERVEYDIMSEQAAYQGQVDDFYRSRLETGV